MPASSTDPLAVLDEVLALHMDSDKWDGARFERIKRVSNSKVGSVGQDFIERLAVESGLEPEFPVNRKGERATQSSWDIRLDGIEFELKTATEDISGKFQFNHIRLHRDYHAVLCLGVTPSEMFFDMWSKAEIATKKAGRLATMEKGANASYKLTKSPAVLHPIGDFFTVYSDFKDRWNASS